jgi:hypothetical protein
VSRCFHWLREDEKSVRKSHHPIRNEDSHKPADPIALRAFTHNLSGIFILSSAIPLSARLNLPLESKISCALSSLLECNHMHIILVSN